MNSHTNQKSSSSSSSSHYTVFIRLPFERREFVDPPPVDWNAAKDNALWKVLSRPTSQDLDWKALAERFNVSLPFLLQQAAWLYDRQLSQVRAQVRRVGTKSSLRPASSGSVARSTSGENPRGNTTDQENLTLSKAGANTGGVPATLRRHASGGSAGSLLRNATANRAVESRSSVRPVTPAGLYERQGNASAAAPPAAAPSQQQQQVPPPPPPLLETRPSFLDAASSDLDGEESTESHSDSDKNDVSTATRTAFGHRRGIGTFRRFGMLSQSKPSLMSYSGMDHYALGVDDDDGEGGALPSFLPLSEEPDEEGHTDEPPSSSSPNHYDDPNATILGSPEYRYAAAAVAAAAAGRSSGLGGGIIDTAITSHQPSTSTTTSTSNSNSVSTIPDLSAADSTGSIGVLGDRRGAAAATAAATAAVSNSRIEGLLASPQTGHARDRDGDDISASMSPRSRTRVLAREETDSTASTGSSFSDLDDASVTRSALEEAYLSNEQNGGIASRVSHAFRSRYLSRQ